MLPVSIRVSIFWAMVLPMPGSSVSFPFSARASIDTGLSCTTFAASL